MTLECKKCGNKIKVKHNQVKNQYTVKCNNCYEMINIKSVPNVIWKCETGTVKRN